MFTLAPGGSRRTSSISGATRTSARRTGGLPASGPPYAETIPPSDPYATLTWTAPTPTDSPNQLSDMQAAVTTVASHGGGWIQIVVHQVCSDQYAHAADIQGAAGNVI